MMRDCNQGRFRQQLRFLQRQFLQDGDLPFTDILSEEIGTQTLAEVGTCWKDRIYPPLVTLWVFLGQVLSQDHSCRAAVARLIAHRVSSGQQPCCAETGGYCQARQRLPEKFFSLVARQTGCALETSAQEQWLWKGRRVLFGKPPLKRILPAAASGLGNRRPSQQSMDVVLPKRDARSTGRRPPGKNDPDSRLGLKKPTA